MKIAPVVFLIAGIALLLLPVRIMLLGETWGTAGIVTAVLSLVSLGVGAFLWWNARSR